jgi:Flp pilus assembly protein TadD
MTVPMAVDLRFHRWNEILAMPQPDPALKTATAFWHYARGMALAATGKVTEAEAEYKILSATEQSTTPDTIYSMPFYNKTKDILRIAENVLGAKIAMAKKDTASAVAQLRVAIAVQDSLKYGEPPDWYFPVRETLGAVLLMSGDNAGAEKVFREDLERNRRNPRSLFGLQQALKAQGRTYDAGFIEEEFRDQWKGDNGSLKIEDLG